ncbi:MAG: tetratricopeptide repeat protein [Proteobacteria bacterium]|nr:tetratricopeptide repeat protein [Pseudomonadota bacterium]
MEIRQFIAELKGRGVHRVTAYYAAGAWVLLQVADVVFPLFDLPVWSITAVLVLTAIGFPIALVLSWLFDLTADGVVEATPITSEDQISSWSRSHIIEFTLITLLTLLVGYMYLERLAYRESLAQPSTVEAGSDRTSIAVMPFVNMSGVPEMEYLGDGLAEEILNLLAKLNELNVSARTSSFYFKNKDVDIKTIGEHLGVGHILEGSVRHVGGRVRVTAQLIKADDGFHLWSETYDRDLSDVLAMQDEIAAKVVDSLQVLLPSRSRDALSRNKRVDPLAYDFYLRGRADLRLPQDTDNLKSAVNFFNRAVGQDQRFADAYAGLCEALLGLYSNNLDVENFKSAEAACHRALTLDRRATSVYIALGKLYRASGQYDQAIDEFNTVLSLNASSADAHVGLGDTYLEAGQEELAGHHYRRASELQPHYWHALMSIGNYLFATGKVKDAIPYYERICVLMPDSDLAFNNNAAAHFLTGDFEQAAIAWQRSLEIAPSSVAYSNVATTLFFLRRFDEAVTLYHKAVELAPENFELWGNLGDAYRHSSLGTELASPMYENAIRLADKRLEVNLSDADTLAMVGHYHANIGQRDMAIDYLNRANALASDNMYVDYHTATALASLSDTEPALEALERALASGYPLHIAAADANLDNIKNTPQFRALGKN